MIGATRVARLQTRAYSFRENSDARYSAEFPLQLYSPSGAVDPAIAFVQPMLLDPVLIQRPEDTNPLDLFVGVKKIDYPTAPAGAYLRIEAHEAPLPHPHTLRPALLLVLALPAPTFVSRINLLGNLLLDPVHDGRGPRSNFGLPRHLDVYAVDGWPPDIAATVPHPRDWRRIYSSSDLRALWGWTPIDVHPTNCSHLVLVMRDLPPLFETTERIGHTAPGEPVTVHGLSIQRLAVWRYEYGIHDAREVSYAPAASWQGDVRGGHQLHLLVLARSESSGARRASVHLLRLQRQEWSGRPPPSALVGLPSKHRHGSEFVSARGYSGRPPLSTRTGPT
ncbi:MAG: hypothetical protein M5T61_18850 [Acidimicrobiia bacterium]|nr:hypothetical protein [Acidimicrobiia bacterium]